MEQLGIIRQNSDALPSHKAFSVSPLPNASDKKVHQIVQTRPVPVQSSARAETQTLAPVVGFHNRQIDRRLGDGQVYKSWGTAKCTNHGGQHGKLSTAFGHQQKKKFLHCSSVTQHRCCSSTSTLQAHDGASPRSWPWAPLSVAHSWTRARSRTLLPAFRIPWPASCPSTLTTGPGRHPTCWVLVGFLHHRQSLLGVGRGCLPSLSSCRSSGSVGFPLLLGMVRIFGFAFDVAHLNLNSLLNLPMTGMVFLYIFTLFVDAMTISTVPSLADLSMPIDYHRPCHG